MTLPETIEWSGDLDDDCTAQWMGLTLRAENLDRRLWWWAVYGDEAGEILGSSNESDTPVTSGKKARAAAEGFARDWILGRAAGPDVV